jgi:hypothetical protein
VRAVTEKPAKAETRRLDTTDMPWDVADGELPRPERRRVRPKCHWPTVWDYGQLMPNAAKFVCDALGANIQLP